MKTIRMKKADWEKWDTALRSGDYTQGPEHMRNPDNGAFCCLGVLQHCLSGGIEVDPDEELPTSEWLHRWGVQFTGHRGFGSGVLLQQPFLPALNATAAEANDNQVWTDIQDDLEHVHTFEAIADAIADAVEFTDQ